jgi:acetyl esterase
VVAAEIAHRVRGLVVSVGYRLAVDGVRFPVPLDDVAAVWRWVTSEVAPDERHRCFIGGASAGAALALAATVSTRDAGRTGPTGVVLAYPFAHFPNPAPDDRLQAELRALPSLFRFPPKAIESMVRNYVGRLSDVPALALPGAARLDGLPPTQVLVSELDDLRTSGELLVRQLREIGNEVELHVSTGMLHGHLNRTPSLPQVDRDLSLIAEFLLMHQRGSGTSEPQRSG